MIILYVFVGIYVILITFFAIKYNKIKYFNQTSDLKNYISIVVPFRNEQENIVNLIDSLNTQTYDKNFFEVLFIDDCSDDQSCQIIEKECKLENYKIIKIKTAQGKKNALQQGIFYSKGHLIVTTDADCRMNKDWLTTINSYFSKYKPKMLIMPVEFNKTQKLLTFKNLQYVEFVSLQASTLAATAINKPIMCNGANLAFEKKTYDNLINPLKNELISGDDIFLMFKILDKFPTEIHYLKNKNVVVTTESNKSLIDFFKQRIRWAYKAKYYTNFFALFVSSIVLLSNISILILFVLTLINFEKIITFFSFFIIKLIIDNILIYKHLIFLKNKKLILLTPLISIFYPFYIVFTVFLSIFIQTKWKK